MQLVIHQWLRKNKGSETAAPHGRKLGPVRILKQIFILYLMKNKADRFASSKLNQLASFS
jgi:hypothetical protein